jgi:hypothetical protein
MKTIDEQSGATSGNDVSPYEVVIDTGVNSNGASFTTSGNSNKENLSGTYVKTHMQVCKQVVTSLFTS